METSSSAIATMTQKTPILHAVMLGGRAPRCRIELHDIAFAVGTSLPSMHEQLLNQWFGQPQGLHIDAYAVLAYADGHRIELREEPANQDKQLYFINIGGYEANELAEQHAYGFYVARNKTEAKTRAKAELLPGRDEVHKDDLYDVDDCLVLTEVNGQHVHLIEDADAGAPEVINGYFPLPSRTVKDWVARQESNG
ncbi:MAG: DUF1543 domain-containing protein [Pseudomonadota bacterium]